ncbi:hypothetical protein EV361DRAFT_941314 [Lentinula raphanica]|nr:hypothetical protein EV361DRAFT_941314 [Lentinula raphanica]
MTIATEACTETRLMVNIYEMSKIQTELGLTRDSFIFFAFLVGNDYDSGVPGIGIQTVSALLQAGLGPSLVTSYARWSPSANLLTTYFQELKRVLVTELRENRRQKLRSCLPAAAEALNRSQFPSPISMMAYLDPPTTWSNDSNGIEGWNQHHPSIRGITEFCRNQIGWSNEQKLLKRFSKSLWPALILFMLKSKAASYDSSTREVQLTATSPEDSGGTPRAIIQSFNPTHLQARKSHQKIQVTFNIAGLVLETGMNATSQLEIRVDVPIPIMATIMQQRRITAFGTTLPPLPPASNRQDEGSTSMKQRKVDSDSDSIEIMSSSDESIVFSDVQRRQDFIEIMSSDDEGQ